MSYKPYHIEWGVGDRGYFPSRVRIYEVRVLPNGKEVSRVLICEVNANIPKHTEWVEIITRALETKGHRDLLLAVLQCVRDFIDDHHPSRCEAVPDDCWPCLLLGKTDLALFPMHSSGIVG